MLRYPLALTCLVFWYLPCDAGTTAPVSGWETCSTGPWGKLRRRRIELDVIDSRLPSAELTPSDVFWLVPARSGPELVNKLQQAGLSKEQLRALFAAAPPELREGWARISPTDQFILDLPAAQRASLYALLARSGGNRFQTAPYQFTEADLQRRLVNCRLSTDLQQLVRRLTYVHGERLLFADKDVLLRRIPEQASRREALRLLMHFHSYQLELQLAPETDAHAVAKYWQSIHTDHLPAILTGIGQYGGSISVAELLTPFAKAHLHTYPARNRARPLSGPDCFWTAANFWREQPDDAFFNPELAAAYFRYHSESVDLPRYGDITLFVNRRTNEPIHAAIYIADDLFFTKNGYHYWAPWVFNTRTELIRTYGIYDAVSVHYFRPKSPLP